jgi:hypothetical protein
MERAKLRELSFGWCMKIARRQKGLHAPTACSKELACVFVCAMGRSAFGHEVRVAKYTVWSKNAPDFMKGHFVGITKTMTRASDSL